MKLLKIYNSKLHVFNLEWFIIWNSFSKFIVEIHDSIICHSILQYLSRIIQRPGLEEYL